MNRDLADDIATEMVFDYCARIWELYTGVHPDWDGVRITIRRGKTDDGEDGCDINIEDMHYESS